MIKGILHTYLKWCLSLVIIAQSYLNFAQNYPVQTNVVTSGPYFNYLSYYADENLHLQAIVTLTDFNAGPINARLRLRIQGPGYTISTRPNVTIGHSFLLEPGVPTFINGLDLAPYLYEANVIKSPSGINLNNLPEGLTTICVDVIRDGISQEVISTNNCSSFFLQRFQPSQAAFPQCGSNLDPNQGFYTFQWTAPIGFVPTIGTEINYTFSLYEWNDPNNFNIFQTGQGLVYQTVTQQPILQLSNFDLTLQNGKDYVWRIKSEITSNGFPVNMIENNGLSGICTFKFGESQTLEEALADGLVINVTAAAEGERKGKASWTVIDNTPGEGLSTFSSYIVSYRKKPTGNESFSFTWFQDTVTSLSQVIYQLEPSTTYEVKVAGRVGEDFVSEPSEVKEFTTFNPRTYACGDADLPYLSPTYQSLATAQTGMYFQIGQFTMKVTEIEPTGSAGRYKGKGLIPIAFLAGANARVEYDDILVDEKYMVREGVINVTTKGVDAWLHEQYQQFIDPIYVSGVVDSAYMENGLAWVVIDGQTQSWEFDPPDYPIIINDDSGTQYIIYPNGNVTVTSYFEIVEEWGVNAHSVVTFSAAEDQLFGFDQKEHTAWHENYEIIQLADSSNNQATPSYYFVSNKSLGKDRTDKVTVNFPSNTGLSNFSYKINNGASQQFTSNTLTIPAQSSNGDFNLEVFEGTRKVGKLKLIVFEEKEVDVVIVPLVASVPSQADLQQVLNATLGQANLKFNLTIAPQWNNSTFTASKTIQLPEDVGLLNKYSPEMKALRDAYFEDSTAVIGEDAVYLFVVPGFSNSDVNGFMVRGKSLGFISSGAEQRIYAHELGHGIGTLKHSWEDNGPQQGLTSNLMDYSDSGLKLTRFQWKQIRSWNVLPSMWDDTEDAESSGGSVHYYAVRIRYNNGVEQITSRTYLGRYPWIKQGPVGSETCTKGTYTTGVNKFFKEVNGVWVPYRYEHFGKVFYLDEITNNEGEHLYYSPTYYNKNYLRRELGGEEEAPIGIYQGVSLCLEGQTTPYSREIRNYELKPVIDHYRSGDQYKQIIYFNDMELSNQFREKYNLMQSGSITYGDLVLWLESHPRKHTDTRWNLSAKQNAVNHLKSYTNDFDRGPVYSKYSSSWTAPYLRSFEYHEDNRQTYLKGLVAYVLKVNGSAWIREAIDIEPSGYYKSGAGQNAIHAQYGVSNCSHNLTSEAAQLSHLVALVNDTGSSEESISEYISQKGYCVLYGLGINERKKLLNQIIHNDESWVVNNVNILWSIVSTIKDKSDEVAMLNLLKLNNSELFYDLYEDINNPTESKYALRFFSAISKILKNNRESFAVSTPGSNNLLNNISLDNAPRDKFCNGDYTLFSSCRMQDLGKIYIDDARFQNGKVIFTKKRLEKYSSQVESGSWLFNTYQVNCYDAIYNEEIIELDPYEEVYIILNDNQDYSVLSIVSSNASGNCLVVPAFYLPLIEQNQIDVFQEQLFTKAITTANIASTFIGAGALFNAYKAARYGLAFFEFLNLTVDVMDLTGVSQQIIPPSLQPYLNTLQIALGAYGNFAGKSAREISQSSNKDLLDDDFIQATVELNKHLDELPTNVKEKVKFLHKYFEHKGLIRNVNQAGDDLLNAFKAGYSKESILAIPKGSRPNPNVYLNQSYIDNHLAKFNGGAVRFTSRNSFNTYGTLGPDGGFILAKSDFDKIIQETGGNLRQIEQRLGLDANYLDGNDVMIVNINNPSAHGLRMPTGNEGGANQYWLPGGKTSGGVNEAVMDFSNSPSYTEIILE